MGFALWVSLLLVYLIMVALYDNWVYPLVVLVSFRSRSSARCWRWRWRGKT